MKIHPLGRDHSGGIDVPFRGDEKRSAVQTGETPFEKAFHAMELEFLLRELDDVSAKLSRVPSTVVLVRYRELVRQLLDRALKGVRLKRDLRWRRTGARGFVILEQTEAWLHDLEDVLFREGQRTRALELMEDIKGCILSLLL
ncbi:MAG: hypothetical protein CSA35_07740 [Dethiosulfovibrio peptidovorans]|nr:MAG: hypothetical protein CSA35_07740 [Dethiosulfovibrio peptidovorans]